MPPQRFALPSEVPGLAARRIAADILDGVLHKHRTLDDQLDGAGAHPGLKALADRDRLPAPARKLQNWACDAPKCHPAKSAGLTLPVVQTMVSYIRLKCNGSIIPGDA